MPCKTANCISLASFLFMLTVSVHATTSLFGRSDSIVLPEREAITNLKPPCTTYTLKPLLAIKKENQAFYDFWDFTQDGLLDVLLYNTSSDNANISLWQKSGESLQLSTRIKTPPYIYNSSFSSVLGAESSAKFSDFNGDGVTDLLVGCSNFTNCTSNNTIVYLGIKNPPYLSTRDSIPILTFNSSACYLPYAIDYDNDGDKDIFLDSKLAAGNTNFMFQNTAGAFVNLISTRFVRDLQMLAYDINRDGFMDIIGSKSIINTGAIGIYYGLGTGNGTFAVTGPLSGSLSPDPIIPINANPLIDTYPDFIYTAANDGTTRSRHYLLSWSNTLGQPTTKTYPFPLGQQLLNVVDWNQDGFEDLLFSKLEPNNTYTIILYPNDGRANFQQPDTLFKQLRHKPLRILNAGQNEQWLAAENNDSLFVQQFVQKNQNSSFKVAICEGQTYQWNNENYTLPGDYSKVFVGAKGCDSVVTLTLSAFGKRTESVRQKLCPGEVFNFRGTTYNRSFQLNDTLRYASGCDSLITNLDISIQTREELGIAVAKVATPECDNTVVVSGNQPPQTFGTWKLLDAGIIDQTANPSTLVRNLQAGITRLVWQLSTSECSAYDSDTLMVEYEGKPLARADVFSTDFEVPLDDIDLIANDIKNLSTNPQLTILDYPRDGVLTAKTFGHYRYSPNRNFSGVTRFSYEICGDLCCDTAIVEIGVGKPVPIPDAITPNGDGINDFFILEPLMPNPQAFPNNELRIYNQWGDEVFSAKPYANDWRGQNSNGTLLTQGIYYFVFRRSADEKIFSGRIGLVYGLP